MNYEKIHNDIIKRGTDLKRIKTFPGEYENHHIIPKCIGGTDDVNNLVNLTPREHYICHKLLYIIHKNNPSRYAKLGKAWSCMARSSHTNPRHFHITSRDFEHMKHINAEYCSKLFKGRRISDAELRRRIENNSNKRCVVVFGIEFNQLKDAVLHFNTSIHVMNRVLSGELDERYLVDPEYAREVKGDAIRKSKKLAYQQRGPRTWEEMHGKDRSDSMKIDLIDRLKNRGPDSEETRKKRSTAKLGKTPWNKGKTSSTETKQKISDARKDIHISSTRYRVIEPSGLEHIVDRIGLCEFWRRTYNCERPAPFKRVGQTGYAKVIQGKWKGFEVYVLPI